MSALIIPFPIDRHLVFIRETARILERKQGSAADRYWQLTCRRLLARLQVQGLSQEDARREVHAFAHAVYAEMQGAARAERESSNPKGAA